MTLPNNTKKADPRASAGGGISVRKLRAGDEEGLRAMFRGLSRETIYRRFHTPYRRVPESLAVHLARHQEGRSLVAVAEGGIVGHAMYAGEVRGEAEVALLVEDQWQSRGVGKRLLVELARGAAGRGVETFTGVALGENRLVLDLVDAVFDGASYKMSDGSYEIRMPLKGLRETAGDTRRRPYRRSRRAARPISRDRKRRIA